MIERFNRISLYWGIPGAVLQILGGAIQATRRLWMPPNADTAIGAYLLLLGTLLLLMGFASYTKAKGRSTAWCLFALLGLPGWILLVTVLSNLKDLSQDRTAATG